MPANVMHWNEYATAYSIGIKKAYKDDLNQHPRTYTEWLKEDTASEFYSTDWITSGLGSMPEKRPGEAVKTDKILTGNTKQHSLTPYALGVVIEYEAMRWDLYKIFDGLPQELSKSSVNRYNVVAYSLFNRSFSGPTSDYKTFQNENIIAASHTRLDDGTWSNQATGNPGISYLAIQQGIIDLKKLRNERGFYGEMEPKQLVTSVDNMFVVEEILGGEYRPDVAGMNKNTIKGRLRPHFSVFIDVPQHWWLIADKSKVKIRMRLGDKPTMSRDTDIRTRSLVMHTYCSFGVAVMDSRGWWGSTGGA